MKYSLNITDIAEEDILSTVKYIANELKNSIAANSLLDDIEKHELILEDTPGIYPFVHDEYLAEKGLKYVKIKNFLLFYTIDEKNKIVNIIRFLYGRRDWKNILRKNGKKILPSQDNA
jgi:plasmid stabilization system protein ParE